MSQIPLRYHAASQSQVLARNAAYDGLIGAALGLLLVSGLIASNMDMRQVMADAHQPLASLGTLVAVVVVQSALVAGLCGAAMRKFTRLD